MEERKSKIDTYSGCRTAGGGGCCFRIVGPTLKTGTMRTTPGVIFGNDSPIVKLGDRKC